MSGGGSTDIAELKTTFNSRRVVLKTCDLSVPLCVLPWDTSHQRATAHPGVTALPSVSARQCSPKKPFKLHESTHLPMNMLSSYSWRSRAHQSCSWDEHISLTDLPTLPLARLSFPCVLLLIIVEWRLNSINCTQNLFSYVLAPHYLPPLILKELGDYLREP